MRAIRKEIEPPLLKAWKRANPNKLYQDLPDEIRRTIRQSALEEQFYLCAYCCQQIENIDDCHNEHIEAKKDLQPQRSLDFTNIVASCNTKNQCGNAHQSQPLTLTPLMEECETELRFKISGRVEGLNDRAIATIQVLNLGDDEKNNRSLIGKRKQLSEALFWKRGHNPQEIEYEDDETLKRLIEDLEKPKDGKLESFAPVVINILRSWLSA
jgi:uncharacterized protein (TIGR02646 family)